MINRGEEIVEVNGVEHLRVPVTAGLRVVDESTIPSRVAEFQHAVADMYYHDAENPDLVWVSFILDAEGPNNNWDHMPRSQLIASHGTAKYKPFDANHIMREDGSMLNVDKTAVIPAKNTIYGVMTHTALADAGGNVLTDKAIAKLDLEDDPFRPADERVTVVAWAALYAFIFPKTVTALVKAINADAIQVSMERWIRQWDFLVKDPTGDTYSAVARATAEKDGTFDKWAKRNRINGGEIYRRSLAYSYGGVASTSNPANGMCMFRDMEDEVAKPAAVKAAASRDPLLENFLILHDEVHARYAVSSTPEERKFLEGLHANVTHAIAERDI